MYGPGTELPEGKKGGPGVREYMNSMEYVLLSLKMKGELK